jgi:hypothetical protein
MREGNVEFRDCDGKTKIRSEAVAMLSLAEPEFDGAEWHVSIRLLGCPEPVVFSFASEADAQAVWEHLIPNGN